MPRSGSNTEHTEPNLMPRLALRPLTLLAILALMAVVVGAQAPDAHARRPDHGEGRRAAARAGPHGQAQDRRRDRQASGARTSSRTSTPRRYYFVKADVDEFMAAGHHARRQDQARATSTSPGWSSTASSSGPTSGSRRCMELLKQKPDFTVDESIVDDPDKIDYPGRRRRGQGAAGGSGSSSTCSSSRSSTRSRTRRRSRSSTIRYSDRNRIVHQFDIDATCSRSTSAA